MVAYSFKRRFVAPIRVGLGLAILPGDEDPDAATMLRPKRQTIRAIGLRRHARPGDTLQLYCGMRSPACFLIGASTCSSVRPIVISICNDGDMLFRIERQLLNDTKAEAFAHSDGFGSIEDMWLFWRREHRGISKFDGLVIGWEEGNGTQATKDDAPPAAKPKRRRSRASAER